DERKELIPGEEGEQGPLERTNAMGVELNELAEEISKARESLETGDTKTNARIDGIEKSVDALFRRVNRRGAEGAANDNEVLRDGQHVGRHLSQADLDASGPAPIAGRLFFPLLRHSRRPCLLRAGLNRPVPARGRLH